MSGSDEEAFASAEEGEEQNKTSSGKSGKGATRSGKGAQAASKDSSKQKGKQQQQRKKKGKGAAKSTADDKESSEKKKPTEESSAKAQAPNTESPKKSETASAETASPDSTSDPKSPKKSETASAETASPDSTSDPKSPKKSETASAKTASPDSTTSDPKSPESVKSYTTHSTKPDSSSDKDLKPEVVKGAGKDTSLDKTVPEGKPDTPEETSAEKKTETPAKSAGEIRQSLSENTAGSAKNPVDQAIPREVDGAAADSKEEQKTDDGGWGWGWGSTILSAATNSLETFSSQVGEGLTTIIDTVESSLGVPTPEDMARVDSSADLELDTVPGAEDTVTHQPHEKEGAEEEVPPAEAAVDTKTADATSKEEKQTTEEKPAEGGSWLSGWGMSNIGNMGRSLVNKSQNLMNTGFEKAETLASGGLDILETIGKKTYSTLTEHDPGLRRAREFLSHGDEKPSLSAVLRDAQDRAKEEEKRNAESEEARKVNFTALFEDNQGMAHVEALEMLSNRSERKVQSLLSAMEEDLLEKLRPELMEIKDTFQQVCDTEGKEEEETEHDFSKLVTENLSELHLGTAPDKLNKVQENVRHWIADFYSHEDHSEIADAKEVHQRAVQSLADVTSKAVEQFHKAGELVLLQKDEDKTYSHRAQSLAKLASVLVTEVDILASKFSHCLNKIGEEKDNSEEVKPMVTSVYVEASNASGYIQDAFQLLLPVLQHATIQSALASTL